ncbi:MAG TPA: lytic transglycosylase domain-containing protein [Solirubrobacteraceae bacterium]|nr:lytic transglycosylase domain-containing protein [Solirubrobacteraceae bacterium]
MARTRSSGSSRRTSARARQQRKAVARRRAVALLIVFAGLILAASTLLPKVEDTVRQVTLPLKHEDIIRQQAADKDLDPALVAGVIYAESRFRDQTSHAGARGLMQITPQTAQEIANRSGATNFEQADLATPQVNIAYGTWYLRWLSERYGDNDALVLAAYNAGTGNVDKWIARDPGMKTDEIPFPETRHYVDNVLEARDDYRRTYRAELGL